MQDKIEPAWTIGIVNYRSAVYVKWQLRVLYEANSHKSFNLIIVDNSRPHENELSFLVQPYENLYNNVQVIYHDPIEKSASGQHGESLTLIKESIKTKYFLVQDPDFFWVQKDYLKILEKYLHQGYVAIGAPYPNKVGIGDPWFPAAYGCAYLSAELKNVDFYADVSEEKRQESFKNFPIENGYEFSYDVGWKIRSKLSNKPHLSFKQKEALDLKKIIGLHSFETISREYFLDKKTIAFHLFRGTFTGIVTEDHKDPENNTNEVWRTVRDKYGEFFYNYIFHYKSYELTMIRLYFRLFTLDDILYNLLMHNFGVRRFIVRNMKKTRLGNSVIQYLKTVLRSR